VECCSTSHKEHRTNQFVRQSQEQAGNEGAESETFFRLALLRGEKGRVGKWETRASCPLTAVALHLLKRKMSGICGDKAPVSILILKYRRADCSCLLCFPRAIKDSKFPPSCLHWLAKHRKGGSTEERSSIFPF